MVGSLGGLVPTRRFKKLIFLGTLVILALFLGDICWRRLSYQSSEMIIQILQKQLEDRKLTSPPDNSACAEYFRLLSLHDKHWNIRSFGDDKTSFTSRKHIVDSVRHLRIFGHCYIHNSAPYGDLNIEKLEQKLFPMFSGDFPTFQRWDGLLLEGFPRQVASSGKMTATSVERGSKASFWKHLKESMNGRGIVISLGEGGVSEVKRLLKVLRTVGNKLPIQLVHKGDLSRAAMQEIINIGRGAIDVEIGDASHSIGNPQDIWFVDAEKSVHSSSAHLFKRFSNKWIASLFNSFEEIILMDCDAVPFVDPELLFNATEYKETGAFFFKDRLIDEYIKTSDLKFYQNLFPLEKEQSLFGLQHTLGGAVDLKKFFEFGYKHIMESGMVIIKREDHFPGLLISTCLQLWKETSKPFYGDKELFWLGQSISGNGEYRFNAYPAGAIGLLNQDANEDLNYICSTQPAHFSKDLRLLWLNGGARRCKIPSWDMDFSKQKYLRQKYSSVEKLRGFYESPINVNGAIIPPRSELSMLQRIKGVKSGFQKCTRLGCAGYAWCAYDRKLDNKGKTIHFTKNEIKDIEFIISVWNAD